MKRLNQKKLILIAISIFLSMIFIDETGISVTLPIMQSNLSMSALETQWVMNGMFLSLAVLVLFGGKLSDHIGHRKTFSIGMFIFLGASLMCALSYNTYEIIIGRVFQGIGASLLLATYAVLIAFVFPENERGNALGTCASVASIFLATGPFIGGAFAHYLNWRYIFWINIPIGLLSLLFVYLSIGKDTIAPTRDKFDITGLLFFVLGFSGLIFSLMQASDYGWTNPLTLSLFICSAILLPFFVYNQSKKSNPLADITLFKNKTFLAGNIILLCTQIVVMSLTYWAIWLQQSLGFSVLKAGIALLPAGIPILFTAKIGGMLLDRKGPKLPITTGCVIVLFGMIWLATTAHYQSYGLAFVGFLSYAIGAPLIISPAIGVVLSSVEASHRGMAAGILNTMRQLGATLCFAIVGVVITNVNQEQLAVGDKLSNHAYTTAFSYGMFITALFAFVALGFSVKGLKNKKQMELKT